MARPKSRHPTEVELEILKILWRAKPCTGRQVRDALSGFRELAYTSVMTIMGIMEDKGYVRRKKQGSSYVYSPRIKQETTTRRMLLDLVERAYDGSVTSAVVNLLATSDIQSEKLEQLRELIRQKTQQ